MPELPREVRALATARRISPESPLDLGIAHVVHLLISQGAALGIEMVESCDASPGHCYPEPTVRVVGSPGAAWHAVGICLDHGLPLRSLAQVWSIGPTGPSGPVVWDLRFRREVSGGLITPPPAEYWSTIGSPEPASGCAPGCDYAVSGYHPKRSGKVLCDLPVSEGGQDE